MPCLHIIRLNLSCTKYSMQFQHQVDRTHCRCSRGSRVVVIDGRDAGYAPRARASARTILPAETVGRPRRRTRAHPVPAHGASRALSRAVRAFSGLASARRESTCLSSASCVRPVMANRDFMCPALSFLLKYHGLLHLIDLLPLLHASGDICMHMTGASSSTTVGCCCGKTQRTKRWV